MITIKRTGFDQFHDPQGGAWIKALIMGDHGVGKTPSAAQWPKPIIADCERGLMSVASLAVPYAEIGGTKDMEELIQHLKMDSRKSPTNRAYQTLIIDTIDTYQRKMINERLVAERKESISGWADWGWLDAKMQQLMEALVSLDMNVVVNMHTKDITEGDDDDRQIISKARLKGDIKDSIFQEFDLIGHMEQAYEMGTGEKKGERVRTRQIRWHSEPRFPSLRDRSNRLPRFTPVTFTDQDYWGLFNTITEGVDDLPETAVVENVGEETAAPVEGMEGGPVSGGALPPAKKTAAKKTAAKKAAATPVAQDQASTSTEAVATEQAKAAAPEPVIETYDRPAVLSLCPLIRVGKPHNFAPVAVGKKDGKEIFNQICTECHVREADLDPEDRQQQADYVAKAQEVANPGAVKELQDLGATKEQAVAGVVKAEADEAVEAAATTDAAKAATGTNDGTPEPDPWEPPAQQAVVVEGDADADAAEQLLAESLGATEEIAPEVQDIAGEHVNGKGTADEPVYLPELPAARESKIIETLDHVHASDGSCLLNRFGDKCGEAPAAAPAAATPAPAKAAGAATTNCGDQPASMVGKKEAKPGCGSVLNSATNAKRAQIAMLRMGTFLCDSCHDAAKAAAA